MYVIEEKKLARLKAGHPFPMVGPTSSVAGPTFLHIKTLPPPARRNNQSMRESCWPRRQLFLVYRRCNINGSQTKFQKTCLGLNINTFIQLRTDFYCVVDLPSTSFLPLRPPNSRLFPRNRETKEDHSGQPLIVYFLTTEQSE